MIRMDDLWSEDFELNGSAIGLIRSKWSDPNEWMNEWMNKWISQNTSDCV